MNAFLVTAADLILGATCPGCHGPAVGMCRSCGRSMSPDPREAWPHPCPVHLREPTPLPPIASGVNEGALRAGLIAWKEQGRFGLHVPLAHLLAASIVHLASRDRPIVLVPVPTSRRSKRARGVDLIDDLARSSVRLLGPLGLHVTVSQALSYTRSTDDQAGLGAGERAANMRGAFALRADRRLRGRDVVVVDDIVTTGATVNEAVRALTTAGHRPVGIAVVAATARHPVDRR